MPVSTCEVNDAVCVLQVPDRGGRVSELDQPPPEMPSFMKRQPGQPQSGQLGFFNYGLRC